jgi:hypothetical protein
LEERVLLAWPVHREAFLCALASHLGLHGEPRHVGDLWELGVGKADGQVVACFFHESGELSQRAREQLAAFHRVVVITAQSTMDANRPGRWVLLTRVLEGDGTFATVGLASLMRDRGPVCFDFQTGALKVGTVTLGEVPLGSREWAFLACLADQLDQFVPYSDLKRTVLSRTGSSGEVDEATFCQKLKSRIKKEYIPGIDTVIATSNKGDGYRLRGEGEA